MASSLAQPSPEAVQLADQLTDLFGRVKALEMKRALAGASIDGGNLPVYDTDGNLQMTIGLLPDGTFGPQYYNPVPPPAPMKPTVTPTWGGLTIGHFGTSASGLEWPMDVSHIEIHLSSLELYSPSEATLIATISAQGGGIFSAMGLEPGVTYWVRLVAVNTSEKKSVSSEVVSGVPGSVVSQEELAAIDQSLETAIADVAAEVDTKSGTFYNDLTAGDAEPTPTKVGDTWFRPDEGYRIYHWDGTAWTPASLGAAAIATGAITTEKLVPGAVTTDALADALAGTIAQSSTDSTAALGRVEAVEYRVEIAETDLTAVGDQANRIEVALAGVEERVTQAETQAAETATFSSDLADLVTKTTSTRHSIF